MSLFKLDTNKLIFPNPELALDNGLLAIGGDLSPERLLLAYQHGIFPWFNKNEPILWWSPNQRAVLMPQDFIINRSFRKIINRNEFELKINYDFVAIINHCAAPRPNQPETWLTPDMIKAYIKLHQLGTAYSYECWHHDKLVGGLYGVKIGKIFFAESMFRLINNASKMAVYFLCQTMLENSNIMIDVQITSPHLTSWGAKEISRSEFLQILQTHIN